MMELTKVTEYKLMTELKHSFDDCFDKILLCLKRIMKINRFRAY